MIQIKTFETLKPLHCPMACIEVIPFGRTAPAAVRLSVLVIAVLSVALALPAAAEPAFAERARAMFPEADHVGDLAGTPPAAEIGKDGRLLGYVLLTDRVAPIPAYSGKPVSVLVGIDTQGVIRGAEIVAHEEPILVIGVTDDTLAAFTAQYAGRSVGDSFKIGGRERQGTVVLDGISGATITMMVLNASILRSVKAVADARGLPLAPGAEARVSSKPVPAAQPPEATLAGAAALEPIWKEVWSERTVRLWALGAGLLVLTVILFLQDWLTRYRRLINALRIAFLLYTLLFIGVYALAQLSVVNVLTFLHAAVRDFRWDIFLIEPLIFLLWSFVAVSLLLWGRGVFCGWLCPYGALQELVNKAAQSARLPQLPLPALLHERLVAIKYVILLALFGLSLQSLPEAVRYAEVEPFKTVFALRLDRPWPFVAYALGLVAISAFNGKFFCKYLCPLGAALTIPSHFRIFDWLRRRKECGRPCQTCATECPSQAIRPTGEIDASECHYCLDCQVIFWDPYKCPPLVERRKRAEKHGRTLHKLPLR